MTTPRLGAAPSDGAAGQTPAKVRRARAGRQPTNPALEVIEGRGHVARRATVSQYLPPRPSEKAVLRTTLLNRLHTNRGDIVALTAPVGYGKTTLLTQWAAQDHRPFVWLAVTPADNNPKTLTHRITAAIATLRFTGAELPPLDGVGEDGRRVRIELADLLDQVATPFVVVLDDVHHATTPASVTVIETLLAHLPIGSHLAVAGRRAGPLGVRKWRAEYDVLEISAQEMAFNPAESSRALGGNSTAATAHAWCEGWPAAVSLAGGLARHDGILSSDPSARFTEIVGQYLESEVLDGLSEADLRFLTRTAILGELNPGACAAVAGDRSAPLSLAALHDTCVLIALEPGANRYRCHPLLRQVLLARLALREPGLLPTLHGRAARWFAGVGDLDSALEHAVLADDLDGIGELIWSLVRPSPSPEELHNLSTKLDLVSQGTSRRSTPLLVAAAWVALLSGDLPQMTRQLALADADHRRSWLSDVAAAEYRAVLALLLAWTCRSGLPEAMELSKAAFEGLPTDSPWLPVAGALSGLTLGLSGDTRAARERLQFSATLSDALDDQLTQADCLAALAALDDDRPTRIRTDEWLFDAEELIAAQPQWRTPTALFTASVMAEQLARTGGQREGMRMLARARTGTVAAGIGPWLRTHAMVRQADAAVLLGDVTTARQLVRSARQLVVEHPGDPSLVQTVTSAEVRLEALPADLAFGVAPFTPAERRILRLLPTHLSYVEMGVLLSVSRHTVKTQALGVYRKLGAVSRYEAVEKASAVGFFDPIIPPTWMTA